jgi:hypothetical protein
MYKPKKCQGFQFYAQQNLEMVFFVKKNFTLHLKTIYGKKN